MTAVRYRDRVIEPIIVPFFGAIGKRFIFIDDNARPHRARIVNERIEHHGITRMEWRPCSPDINYIEHVWAEMSRRLNQLQQSPDTLQELANALQGIWEAIPQDFINNLIMSLPN
ncbi:Transposable element Tc1 transposase-like Protein [Tribolium castaneum]|uniref:Transposable element Tc1 transposase-like Protein n=1 Tax=Tribolium castaneum TaxID=7070 RepID=D7EJI2_TRICA|nr:Transposable element Tc1 transposase-like Protein [Tribolium castaneum]